MMNKIAAIYARVSSDRQKEDKTIASQTASLRDYAQAPGYTVPADWVFEDEGDSGATLARPGLERLRDLVAEGQVQVVLVYGPDRLSRKYAYQVLLLEEFCRQGVETVFLKSVAAQTPEEQLVVQFQGMIAEYERAQIAEWSALRLSLCQEERGDRCLLSGGRRSSCRRSRGVRLVHRRRLEHRGDRPPTQRPGGADALGQESMGAFESVGDAAQPGVCGPSGIWKNGTSGAQTGDPAVAAEGRLFGPEQRSPAAAKGSMDWGHGASAGE
jgi:site-specific DNA recombinase